MSAKIRVISALVLLLFVVFAAAGCAGDAARPEKVESPPKVQSGTSDKPAGNTSDTKFTPVEKDNGKVQITTYAATRDANYLVPEVHFVAKNSEPARMAVELLIAGTRDTGLEPVIPPGTKLNNLYIKDGVAYVDFSSQIVKGHWGGSAAERLTVAAIVNTLTQFPEVDRVQILIDGKKRESIAGHVDISEPLSRSEGIIKKAL